MFSFNKKRIFFSTLMIVILSGCSDEALLSALNQRQANEVLAVLQSHHIAAQKQPQGKELYKIRVGKDDTPAAINILQSYHLPSSERLEIADVFPSDALVSSPQTERARLISAIEQRLEQSLSGLETVIDARVHVSYPLNGDSRIKTPMKVSAIIFYMSTAEIDEDEMRLELTQFIKNAFSELESKNITIILSQRKLLDLSTVEAK